LSARCCTSFSCSIVIISTKLACKDTAFFSYTQEKTQFSARYTHARVPINTRALKVEDDPNAHFRLLRPLSLKIPKKSTIDNQAVTKKMQKKCKNIWSYQKKAVLLHPLSLKKRVTPKNESNDL
jgi:hypothetical protein